MGHNRSARSFVFAFQRIIKRRQILDICIRIKMQQGSGQEVVKNSRVIKNSTSIFYHYNRINRYL